MQVTFEKMGQEHLDQVAEIEKASFPLPWSRSAFDYELAQNDFALYIVAVAVELVVGYAGMWLIMDEAHITNLAVKPGYRMQKVGKALMLEMIGRAMLLGSSSMTLEVRPSNAAARRLYATFGFEDRGLRKRYYTDNNEDAIIMWKDGLACGKCHLTKDCYI